MSDEHEHQTIDEDDEDQVNVCARCGTLTGQEQEIYYSIQISKERHTEDREIEVLDAIEVMELCRACGERPDACQWLGDTFHEHLKDYKEAGPGLL